MEECAEVVVRSATDIAAPSSSEAPPIELIACRVQTIDSAKKEFSVSDTQFMRLMAKMAMAPCPEMIFGKDPPILEDAELIVERGLSFVAALNDMFKEPIASLEVKQAALTQAVRDAEDNVVKSRQEVASLKPRYEEAVKSKQGLETQLSNLMGRIEEADKKIAEVEQSARSLQSERERLQQERDDVRGQLSAEKDKVKPLENERCELEATAVLLPDLAKEGIAYLDAKESHQGTPDSKLKKFFDSLFQDGMKFQVEEFKELKLINASRWNELNPRNPIEEGIDEEVTEEEGEEEDAEGRSEE